MIPVLPALLAGTAAALGILFAERHKQKSGGEAGSLGPLAADRSLSQVQSTPEKLSTRLCQALDRLDEACQSWIREHIDPLLAGRSRMQQLQTLTSDGKRELSAREKSLNHGLLLSPSGLGLIGLEALSGWPFYPAVIAIGLINAWAGLKEAWRVTTEERRFSLLHLLLVYFLVIWFGGYYLIGIIGMVFGSLCEKFEHLARIVTRHSLTDLLGEQPRKVWVLVDGVEVEIPFEQLQAGDIMVLDAGQSVPVDGVVVQGLASVDQHRLTGESEPVEKSVGDPVMAATLVLGGRIRVRVEKTGAETVAARIGEILNHTLQDEEIRVADLFKSVESTRYPMLAGGVLGLVVGGPKTAAAMLGCNYLLSLVPLRQLTLINGLKAGTEHGILIKDGRALERLPEVDTVVFDKTGTLTLEEPQVVRVHACWGRTEHTVLRFAAAAEHRQTHPIARAILAAAARQEIEIPHIDEAHYEIGFGLRVTIEGHEIRVGSRRFLETAGLTLTARLREALEASREQGHSLVFVAQGRRVIGAIELAASIRPEVKQLVGWLEERGIERYILSGDHEAPTRRLAEQLQMNGYFADTLPDYKAEKIKELQEQGHRVCFIGDGINDLIALRQAEVSISLRGATTIATDAAQVVLMDDDLAQLKVLWELTERFEHSIDRNQDQSTAFSLVAAAGVLLLPYKFWLVFLLGSAQAVTGIRIASRPLIDPPTEEDTDCPIQME